MCPEGRLKGGRERERERERGVEGGRETEGERERERDTERERERERERCLTVIADGVIVSGSSDNTLRLWDVAGGTKRKRRKREEVYNSVCIFVLLSVCCC